MPGGVYRPSDPKCPWCPDYVNTHWGVCPLHQAIAGGGAVIGDDEAYKILAHLRELENKLKELTRV